MGFFKGDTVRQYSAHITCNTKDLFWRDFWRKTCTGRPLPSEAKQHDEGNIFIRDRNVAEMPTAPPKGDTSRVGHLLHITVRRRPPSAAGAATYVRTCWGLKSLNNQREPDKANQLRWFSLHENNYRGLSSHFFFFVVAHLFFPLWSLIAFEMLSPSNLESKLSEEQGPSLFILLQSALHTCGAWEIMNNNNYMQPIWPLGPVSGCRSIIWSSEAQITHCLPLNWPAWGSQSCSFIGKDWNEP